MDRRSFLKFLGAVPAVVALPSESKIWIPETDIVLQDDELITPLKSVSAASNNGDLIGGWFLSIEPNEKELLSDMSRSTLVPDASRYFPAGVPLMVLNGCPYEFRKHIRPGGLGSSSYHVIRFLWKGQGMPIENGERFPIRAVWKNMDELYAFSLK